jgi:hypothetical protein
LLIKLLDERQVLKQEQAEAFQVVSHTIIHLLDYAFFMLYWEHFEMLPLDLALKRGFHPWSKASFGCYCYQPTKTATSRSIVAIEDIGNL